MDISGRIRVVQQVRDGLQRLDWADMQLILSAFGYDTSGFDDQFGPSVQDLLIGGKDETLQLVAQHLGVDVPGLPPAASTTMASPAPPSRREPLYLFASHLVTHRSLLGDVAEHLRTFGITLFVAHSSIEPDQAWYDEIVKALRNAHGGVAFLHDGFIQSTWCDQEVGWLLGREVPVFSIMFNKPPYGPLSKWQALDGRHLDANGIAVAILDRVSRRAELEPNLMTSLVSALRQSSSFRTTDLIWARLRTADKLTPDQCEIVMDALEQNNQVANQRGNNPWSALDGEPYGKAIPKFLHNQPGVAHIASRLSAWES